MLGDPADDSFKAKLVPVLAGAVLLTDIPFLFVNQMSSPACLGFFPSILRHQGLKTSGPEGFHDQHSEAEEVLSYGIYK